MDATDDFAHSGTVTMIGKDDFEKSKIFGFEGYFIRIINPDGKYSDGSKIASRPIINDIKFNAVNIVQKDTRMPEYFSIRAMKKIKFVSFQALTSQTLRFGLTNLVKLQP